MEKPRLLRDSNRRESGLWLSVVSIDALQPISKDTDNNNVMYICWWTNKKSAREIRMELTIGHLQDGFMIINTAMCRTIARSMARVLIQPGFFFSFFFHPFATALAALMAAMVFCFTLYFPISVFL